MAQSNGKAHAGNVADEGRTVGAAAMTAAENVGRELKANARDVGTALMDAGSTIGEEVSAAAQHTYDSLVSSGKQGAKQIESKVQESPLVALGVAFGLGMLACSLLGRRG